MRMEMLIIVMVASFVLSVLLTKLSEKKGWKKKAEKYIDDKPYMGSLPWILGAVALLTIIFGPRLGMPGFLVISLQVVSITVAMFLFDLFR